MQSQYLHEFAELQNVLIDCAGDLFGAYGYPLEHVQDGADPDEAFDDALVSTIGYAAEGLRGALLVLTSKEVVKATAGEENANDTILCDALGEFSNMLLGRLKNELLARGAVLHVALPLAVPIAVRQLPVSTAGTCTWHAFAGEHGMLFLRFQAVFEPGFALHAPRRSAVPIVEGALIEL